MQLKLARPVSVPAVKRGPGGRPGQRGPGVKRRTSFYLPRGTVKHLHVLSHTRASEVISALLRKFTVVDDPRKFALFERSEKDEQGSAWGSRWCPHSGTGLVVVVVALWWQHSPGSSVPVRWWPPCQWWPHCISVPTVAVSPVVVGGVSL